MLRRVKGARHNPPGRARHQMRVAFVKQPVGELDRRIILLAHFRGVSQFVELVAPIPGGERLDDCFVEIGETFETVPPVQSLGAAPGHGKLLFRGVEAFEQQFGHGGRDTGIAERLAFQRHGGIAGFMKGRPYPAGAACEAPAVTVTSAGRVMFSMASIHCADGGIIVGENAIPALLLGERAVHFFK